MADIVTSEDLPAAVVAATEAPLLAAMVAGANARATRVAPCLADTPTDEQLAEAKLVLIGAIKRWTETNGGEFQQQTAGPFSVSVDTRQRGGFNLWPSEIEQLQDICATDPAARRAFMIDQVQPADPALDVGGYANRPDLWFQMVQPVPPEAP